jgi:hypothetical protein
MINGRRRGIERASDPSIDQRVVHEDFHEAPPRMSLLCLVFVSGLVLLSAVSFLWSILRVIGIV